MKFSSVIAAMVVLSLAVAGLAACDKKGSAEKVGESIDKAVKKVGDKVEEAGESIDKTAKKVGDKIEDTGDKVKDAVKDAKK